jgi:hypothetical protein
MIDLENNHSLHGSLMGLAAVGIFKLAGYDMMASITYGTFVGTGMTVYMFKFGHDIPFSM